MSRVSYSLLITHYWRSARGSSGEADDLAELDEGALAAAAPGVGERPPVLARRDGLAQLFAVAVQGLGGHVRAQVVADGQHPALTQGEHQLDAIARPAGDAERHAPGQRRLAALRLRSRCTSYHRA